MVSTVSPNANATPINPMPSSGKPAASTALPQPPKTSQKVPKNSAASFRDIDLSFTIHPKFLSASPRISITGKPCRPPFDTRLNRRDRHRINVRECMAASHTCPTPQHFERDGRCSHPPQDG